MTEREADARIAVAMGVDPTAAALWGPESWLHRLLEWHAREGRFPSVRHSKSRGFWIAEVRRPVGRQRKGFSNEGPAAALKAATLAWLDGRGA